MTTMPFIQARWASVVVTSLLLVAVLIRATDLSHPINGHLHQADREIEAAAQARALYRAGWLAPLPALPWQEPATVHAVPLHAWLVARCYALFGERESVMRGFSLAVGLLGLYLAWRLAIDILPRAAAEASMLFLAFSPLSVRLASSTQPEGLSLLLYLSAMLGFVRWVDSGQMRWFWLSVVATSLVVMSDFFALHLLLVYLGLAGERFGWRKLIEPGMATLLGVPIWLAAVWYWTRGSDGAILAASLAEAGSGGTQSIPLGEGIRAWLAAVPSLALTEVALIWMPAGVVLAWFGKSYCTRSGHFRILLWWLIAVTAAYLCALPRSATLAHIGVHAYSLPLAALCVGLGFAAAVDALPKPIAKGTSRISARLAVFLFAITLANQLLLVYFDEADPRYAALDADAQAFTSALNGAGIAVVGGERRDPLGLQVHDRPTYFLYRLDRSGEVLDGTTRDLAQIAALPERGIDYLIAEHRWLRQSGAMEAALRARFPVLREGSRSILFSLRPAIQ